MVYDEALVDIADQANGQVPKQTDISTKYSTKLWRMHHHVCYQSQ